MTPKNQKAVCMAIAKACMWGQGGIASVILDDLQQALPTEPSWHDVYRGNHRQAVRDVVGVITDESELLFYIQQGYRLTNYQPGEMSLHRPSPAGGLVKLVSAELAEKYGPVYDSWNYQVHQARRS